MVHELSKNRVVCTTRGRVTERLFIVGRRFLCFRQVKLEKRYNGSTVG